MKFGATFWLKLAHGLLLGLYVVGSLLLVGLGVLAYGLPGRWFQGWLDEWVPQGQGRLAVQWLAYIPGRGLTLEEVTLHSPEGRLLASVKKGRVDFHLLTSGSFVERLKAIDLDDLYVAQIVYDDEAPEVELPDFAAIELPEVSDVALHLTRPNILELRVEEASGRVTLEKHRVLFQQIKGRIHGEDEYAEGEVIIDLQAGVVSSTIRGFSVPERIRGVWHALDFPLIEEYCDNFTLTHPIWADCTFNVGLDKYRNIFELRLDLTSDAGGAYNGVPFDSGETTIRCRGIWDTETVIEPMIARRAGKIAATGSMTFDCATDTFSFHVQGDGIFPEEYRKILDLDCLSVIPKLTSDAPPVVVLSGAFPFLLPPTPADITLSGSAMLSGNGAIMDVAFADAQTDLSMTGGTFSIENLRLTVADKGSITGNIRFAIPPTADYTDLSAQLDLVQLPLSKVLAPLNLPNVPDLLANGTLALGCRTDDKYRESLHGTFSIELGGSIISRLRLFAGFTDVIADNIPGISSITDVSTAKLEGTIKDGLIDIPDFNLTGDLFAMEGPVTYNLPKDKLYALLSVGNFKRDSVMGTLTRWALVPATRFLLQIELTGPIADPEWNIVTFVEKLWDVIPSFSSDDESEEK